MLGIDKIKDVDKAAMKRLKNNLKKIIEKNNSELVIYESKGGDIKLDVNLENETVWLSLERMSKLFWRDKSVISRHIRHVFEEGELEREKVVANFATTTKHGAIEGKTKIKICDMIICSILSVLFGAQDCEDIRDFVNVHYNGLENFFC